MARLPYIAGISLTGTVSAAAQIVKPAELEADDDSHFIYVNGNTTLGSTCSALTDRVHFASTHGVRLHVFCSDRPCAFRFNTTLGSTCSALTDRVHFASTRSITATVQVFCPSYFGTYHNLRHTPQSLTHVTFSYACNNLCHVTLAHVTICHTLAHVTFSGTSHILRRISQSVTCHNL